MCNLLQFLSLSLFFWKVANWLNRTLRGWRKATLTVDIKGLTDKSFWYNDEKSQCTISAERKWPVPRINFYKTQLLPFQLRKINVFWVSRLFCVFPIKGMVMTKACILSRLRHPTLSQGTIMALQSSRVTNFFFYWRLLEGFYWRVSLLPFFFIWAGHYFHPTNISQSETHTASSSLSRLLPSLI